ncbi:MAG: FliI/YscN family ATPase [Planctomycetaceae bacterium]|nr:FliI/YscN family ATPase [Planctomycetaceae bacterium]
MVSHCDGFRTVGRLLSVRDVLRARLPAQLGEHCEIVLPSGARVPAEVIGVDRDEAQLMCLRHCEGLRYGLSVIAHGAPLVPPGGVGLLGRCIDGLGCPVDARGPLAVRIPRNHRVQRPAPLQRRRIITPLVTGQRVIDGLLTVGKGQRIGLFAGSGVGKSTLLGEVARSASSDVNVVALIGERGREVRPFIEDSLGPAGLRRSVVVVATSDETPLMRIQAVRTAIHIAEGFRDAGADVLFFMDSLSRLAYAQREVGLARGEMPGSRGYPASVMTVLAETLERLGTGDHGSITGIITVLVDGDDPDEPIADAARSILDGHILLDRKLASRGWYPAVDILHSVSRLFNEVASPDQMQAAAKVRQIIATYRDVEELVQLGAYPAGSSHRVDIAIQLMPAVELFLRQATGEHCSLEETVKSLRMLADAWQFN